MKKTALVIMAAGIGSRYGKGIKQLEKVGPGGEIIMDYSIHDALEAEDYVDLQSSSANVGSAGSGRVAGRPIDELTAMRMRRKIAAQRAAREAA